MAFLKKEIPCKLKRRVKPSFWLVDITVAGQTETKTESIEKICCLNKSDPKRTLDKL